MLHSNNKRLALLILCMLNSVCRIVSFSIQYKASTTGNTHRRNQFDSIKAHHSIDSNNNNNIVDDCDATINRIDNIEQQQKGSEYDRRTVLSKIVKVPSSLIIVSLSSTTYNNNAYAAVTTTDVDLTKSTSSSTSLSTSTSSNTELPVGLLDVRVNENVMAPPPYNIEVPDVYYPKWFNGIWNVQSTTESIMAPCGVLFFGTNTTYQKAIQEIGTTLQYSSRFLLRNNNITNNIIGSSEDNEYCIADREYNVRSIAQSALGINSVLDIPVVSPNTITAVLAPTGSNTMLRVDLITLNRRQEFISNTEFHCAEVVREIITPINTINQQQSIPSIPTLQQSLSQQPTQQILKEIETISLYTYNNKTNTVSCKQRSASYLLPSQQSVIAMQMFQATNNRPVDVRFYNVKYTKRT